MHMHKVHVVLHCGSPAYLIANMGRLLACLQPIAQQVAKLAQRAEPAPVLHAYHGLHVRQLPNIMSPFDPCYQIIQHLLTCVPDVRSLLGLQLTGCPNSHCDLRSLIGTDLPLCSKVMHACT